MFGIGLFVTVEAESIDGERILDRLLVDSAPRPRRAKRRGAADAEFEYFKCGHDLMPLEPR
jgi:hypothetical protein